MIVSEANGNYIKPQGLNMDFQALDQRVNCCWSIDLNGFLFSLCTMISKT